MSHNAGLTRAAADAVYMRKPALTADEKKALLTNHQFLKLAVDGKEVRGLTLLQLSVIVGYLLAERGWINAKGFIEIPDQKE